MWEKADAVTIYGKSGAAEWAEDYGIFKTVSVNPPPTLVRGSCVLVCLLPSTTQPYFIKTSGKQARDLRSHRRHPYSGQWSFSPTPFCYTTIPPPMPITYLRNKLNLKNLSSERIPKCNSLKKKTKQISRQFFTQKLQKNVLN